MLDVGRMGPRSVGGKGGVMDAETSRQERIMGIRRIVRQLKADIAAKRERKEVKHVPPYRRLPHGGAGVCADNAMPGE